MTKNMNKQKKSSKTIKLNKLLDGLRVKQSKMKKTNKSVRVGAITSVNTAPVSIGNSIKGSSNRIVNTQNGVRIIGRDFMFQPIGTAANVKDWTTVGGCPLTPACFADSALANYMRMYSKFRFKSVVVHYITSSSTSSTGDVMFYYNKDRSSVYLNQTSSNLLNFVLSDDNTVLGPQWINHSAQFKMGQEWKLCDYGMHSGIEEYADGDVYLLSKTSTTDSPGYVLFDYDIEFAEKNVAIRLTRFPITQIIWTQVCFNNTSNAVTKDSTIFQPVLGGNTVAGVTSPIPAGSAVGDIYKVICDVTNSRANSGNAAAWTNITVSNIFDTSLAQAIGVQDGTTLYALVMADGSFRFFPNVECAYSNSAPLFYGVTATVTFTLCANVSYIGSMSLVSINPTY